MVVRLSLAPLAVAILATASAVTAQPVQPLLLAAVDLAPRLATRAAFPLLPAAAAAPSTAGPTPLTEAPETPESTRPTSETAAASTPREPLDAGEYGIEYELSFRDADSFLDRLSAQLKNLVEQAMTYLGTPYRLGGASRRGVDCSGLVGMVYGQQGLGVPRTAAKQFSEGVPVGESDLRPGDLVFFHDTYKRGISHVGIFVGDGRFIHAAGRRKGVIVSDLSRPYYRHRYAGARRLAPQPPPPSKAAAAQSKTEIIAATSNPSLALRNR